MNEPTNAELLKVEGRYLQSIYTGLNYSATHRLCAQVADLSNNQYGKGPALVLRRFDSTYTPPWINHVLRGNPSDIEQTTKDLTAIIDSSLLRMLNVLTQIEYGNRRIERPEGEQGMTLRSDLSLPHAHYDEESATLNLVPNGEVLHRPIWLPLIGAPTRVFALYGEDVRLDAGEPAKGMVIFNMAMVLTSDMQYAWA